MKFLNKKLSILAIILILSSVPAWAMEKSYDPNSSTSLRGTDKEKQQTAEHTVTKLPKAINPPAITADNILDLAPAAPEDLNNQVIQWLSANPLLTASALHYKPLVGKMRAQYEPTNMLLADLGHPNMSDWNYVFKIVNGQMIIIKIAGPLNVRENLNRLREYPWGKELNKADYDYFAQKLEDHEFDSCLLKGVVKTAPKTFQTISRMAHYLWFLHERKNASNNFGKIFAPEMFLVHIPGRPKTASDRNYVVVERHLDGLKKIESLTEAEKEQVKAVIRKIGLFCCNKGSILRAPNGDIALVDFEQPNNTSPRNFFHKVDWVFNNNVQAGLNDFADNFEKKS